MRRFFARLKKYQFEIRHLLVLFIVLALFQIILSYLQTSTTRNLLNKTLELYKRDSAEQVANLTTTAMELLLDISLDDPELAARKKDKIIESFNILFSQQTLQQNVERISILISLGDEIMEFDDGKALYSFIFEGSIPANNSGGNSQAARLYKRHRQEIIKTEEIYTVFEDENSFRVLVPIVPRGEFAGVVYMNVMPDLRRINEEIAEITDETSVIFLSLIFFGFIAMFYITSHTVSERDMARKLLYEENERQIIQQIEHEKEATFTRRIYHAHHKAEKIIGFIKEDIDSLNESNIEEFKKKAMKYSNFVARVIYDMKSYDPPIHAIRNPMFDTDLNEMIEFIIRSVFQRARKSESDNEFVLDLSDDIPTVHVNEYVAWQVIEPLIQNSIEHNPEKLITVWIKSRYEPKSNLTIINIADNGKGVDSDLLEIGKTGIKKIFEESTSTKLSAENSGYGCHLAYEISNNKCGWDLDIENLAGEGCQFTLTIPNV